MHGQDVSCRNLNIIAKYVKNVLGRDTFLFENLPYPENYLRNEHNWVPLLVYTEIMERAILELHDDEAPYKMGLSAQQLQSWGAFEHVGRVLATIIFGPIIGFKQLPKYNRFFNRTKELELIEVNKEYYIRNKFKDHINPVDDHVSDAFMRGIITGIPKIWSLPGAEIKPILLEYDLVYLLEKIGKIKKSDIEIKDGILYVEHIAIGKEVVLLPHDKKQEMLLGNYRERKPGEQVDKASMGILITTTFSPHKRLTLTQGEIYNAPHFIFGLDWEKIGFFKKIYNLITQTFIGKRAYLEGLEESLSTIRQYVETLEDKVVERTKELNIAKSDAEYWRAKSEDLLSTMLPEKIMKKMMLKKLDSEETSGTIVYTDLANFTNFAESASPQEVTDMLTAYFTDMSKIITEYGGWINKFLGDGILIIFGLDGDLQAPEKAIKASIEMQKAMEKYPWKLRIGIASGPFISGEFGTQSVRRFDSIGRTLNLGNRLQSSAHSQEILISLETYDLTKELFEFDKPRYIMAKGIGKIRVFPVKYL